MRNRVLVCSITVTLLLSSFAVAQSAPTPEPTFRSNAELVMIPAVVRGKSGHVSGLKKEDFVVLEDGKPRHIAVFSEVQGKAETVQHAPLPHGEFTNELIGVDSPKRLTVIAVDMINTAPLDQTIVREALLKFLSQAAPNGEPTALVAIEQHSLRLIYDFTTDPQKLAAAVKEMKSEQVRKDEPSASLENERVSISRFDPSSVQALLGWLQAKQGEEDMLQFQWRMGRFSTVEAMRQLTSWLAGIPGRKSLIWATGGLPFSESTRLFIPRDAITRQTQAMTQTPSLEALDQQADLWERLNAANIVVYPIDARRMVNTAYDVISPEFKNSPTYVNKEASQFRERDRVATFKTIADATGGTPCYNTADLVKCFFEASQDSSDYYHIGYYVDRSTKPGWHKLQVKCLRDGTHVRARRGFLYKTGDDVAARNEEMSLALYSPLQNSALPFRGRWLSQIPQEGDKRKVQFELQIPPKSVSIDENLSQIGLEIAAVAFDKKGHTAATLAQSLASRLNTDAVNEIRRGGLNYTNVIELSPGEYVVRFVVRDNATRRTGSVLVGMKVN